MKGQNALPGLHHRLFFFCEIDRDECIFILIDAHGLTPLLPFPGKYSIDKEYRIDPVDSTSPSPFSPYQEFLEFC